MRLSDKRVSQRGVTLVELAVVLAILSIITTMIVSFTFSMRDLTTKNEEMYNEMERLTFGRDFIEKWFYSFDESGSIYSVDSEGKLTITINNNDEVKNYSISITEQDVIIFDYPNDSNDLNDSNKSYLFEGIRGIEFENVELNNNSTGLYKCTILYGEDSEFAFVLGRRS